MKTIRHSLISRCVAAAFTFALVTSGAHAAAYGWGYNNNGQVGTGGAVQVTQPVAVDMSGALAGKTVTATATGTNHTVALTSDGMLYSWGTGTDGQMGNGTTNNSSLPVAVDMTGVLAGKTVTAVAAGDNYSVVLTSEGKMYGWGGNGNGQLGDASNTSSSTPVAVNTTGALAGKTVTAIAAGANNQTAAVTSDGKVFTWGGGTRGDGTYFVSSNTPVAVTMTGVLSGKTVTAASVGQSGHVLLLTSDGKVFGFGNDGNYQLGDGAGANATVPVAMNMSGVLSGKTVTAIAAGGYFSAVLTSEGKVYTCGNNNSGQIGDGTSTFNATTPVAVSTSGVLSGKTVTALVAGSDNVLAVTSEGKVVSWGGNNYGQLGNGTMVQSNVPVAVDISGVLAGKTITKVAFQNTHVIAQGNDGKLYGWGNNLSGQLGNGDSVYVALPAAVKTSGVLAGKTVTALAAGGGGFSGNSHTVALTSDGKVFAWGDGSVGQLGNGNTSRSASPVAVDMSGVLAGKTVTAVAAGATHTVALTSEGKLYSWGAGSNGQLGNGTSTNSTTPVAVNMSGVLAGKTVTAIAAGGDQTVVLTSDGKVYSWGFGYLGNGSSYAANNTPVAAGTLGVIAGKTMAAIAVGNFYVVTLASDGTLYGWGTNSIGQLGDGSTTERTSPVAVDMSGVLSGKTVTAIATGSNFSMALTSEGKVYAWGTGGNGQMGNGQNNGANSSPVAVSTSGVLAGKTITAITGGAAHAVALASDGTLYAWGYGGLGQMGNGSMTGANLSPVAVTMSGALAGKTVNAVSAGYYHTMVMTNDPDTMPPALSFATLSTNGNGLKYAGVGKYVRLTFEVSEAIATPVVTLAGRAATVTSLGGNQWQAQITVVSGDTQGSVAISVAYQDLAGNAGTTVMQTTGGTDVLIDTVALAPSAPVLSAAQDTGVSNSDGITKATSFTFTGSMNVDDHMYLYDGAQLVDNYLALFTPGYTFTVTPTEGTHSYSLRLIDRADNVSGFSAATTIVVDRTAPTIAAPSGGFTPLALQTDSGTGTAALPDYRSQAVTADSVGVVSMTQSPAPGSARSLGTTSVSLTASDAAGNTSSTLQFDVLVVPGNSAPLVAVDGGAGGATTTFVDTFSGTGGGMPAAWMLVPQIGDPAGTVVESGGVVTITDKTSNDPKLIQTSGFGPVSSLTATVEVASMTADQGAEPELVTGLGSLLNNVLVVQFKASERRFRAMVFGGVGQLAFALPGTGEHVPGYAGGALDFTVAAGPTSFRITATTGYDSGDIAYSSAGAAGFTSIAALGSNPGVILGDSADGQSTTGAPSVAFDRVSVTAVAAAGGTGVTAVAGVPATQTGTFSDAQGNATVTLSASSGSITQNNGAGTWQWTGTGVSAGTSTITITATDNQSATATASFSFTVTPANALPVVAVDGGGAGSVGFDEPFNGTDAIPASGPTTTTVWSDPGFDANAASTVVKSGGVVTLTDTRGGGGPQFIKSPEFGAVTGFTLTVNIASLSADAGGTPQVNMVLGRFPGGQALVLKFDAVSKAVSMAGGAGGTVALGTISGYAGGAIEFVVTADADSFRVTSPVGSFDSGDRLYTAIGASGFDSIDDLTAPLSVLVGVESATGTQNTTLAQLVLDRVTLVATSVSGGGSPTITAAEGATATQTGTFSDADGNGTVTLTASSGTVTQNSGAGTWSWSPAAGFDGPASSTITITATDAASAVATTSFTFTATNVAPTVAISAAATADEDTSVSYTITATDASSADQTAGFAWSINYGDGTGVQAVAAGTASPLALSHTFTAPGTYNVTATATDKDNGTSTTATKSITIADKTAPAGGTFTFSPASPLPARTPMTLSANGWSDASGPLTYRFFFFDTPFGPASPSTTQGFALFLPGDYTVNLEVADPAGNVTRVSQSFTITPLSQAIAFTLPATAATTDSIPLSATGGASGNEVTFSVRSGPGAISGNTLSFTGPGSVVVRASQDGGSSYSAAPDVERTILVSAAGGVTAMNDRVGATSASVLIDVLANDSDTAHRPLSIVSVTQPAMGKVTIEAGKLRFTPKAKTSVTSALTFTYTAQAGGDTATATVTIVPPSSGNYVGLLSRAGVVRGRIAVTVTATGMATGGVRREGPSFSFKGSVNGAGSVTFGRSSVPVPALLRIPLGALDGAGQPTLAVTMSDTTPGQFLTGTAERSPYDAAHPAPQAGRYTLVAGLPSGGTGPQTGATLVCNIAANGAVTFGGRLADNSPGAQGGSLLSGGRFPFYTATGSGAVRRDLTGTLVFNRSASPAVTGTLHWKVPAGVLGVLSAGVDQDYSVQGLPYTPTNTGLAMFSPSSLMANLTIGLPSPFVRRVSLDGVARAGSQRLYFSGGVGYVNPANGFFSGTIAVNRVNRPFFGVVLQGGGINAGSGNFLDSNAIRPVTFAP